jgi:hypothetical protein
MNPYPFVIPIDGRHISCLPASHARAITEACRRVRQRTGFRAVYNQMRGSVVFMATDHIEVGGSAEEFVYDRGRYLPINVDQTVRRLSMTKRSYAAKKAAVAERERRHAEARERYAQAQAIDIAPELRSLAKFQMRKLTEGRHSRPMILTP